MKTIPMQAAEESSPSLWQRWSEQIAVLTKARLTAMVLLTTFAGFILGSRGATDWVLLFHTLLGTALVAASASALNQLLESEWDATMHRTASRPLPTQALHPDEVLIFSFITAVVGLLYLTLMVNFLASLIAGMTLATYVFIYTPLKRISTLNTVIGAIPGALPPVIGWAASNGKLPLESFVLFAILFLWQMPHFLAIAWRCRADYERAGFKMLPILDPSGASTGRQALVYAAALLPISLWPTTIRMTGGIYFGGAFILGLIYLGAAWRFQRVQNEVTAKRLFFTSIVYLPLLLLAMTLDMRRS